MRHASRLIATAAILTIALARPARAVPRFGVEPGVRLSSASFGAATGNYPALRVYYVSGSSQILSATTTDGYTFVREAGVRVSSLTAPALDIAISSITGVAVLPTTGGQFRLAYSVVGTTGTYRIYTALSTDGVGLNFATETGPIVNVANTFAGYPNLIKLGTGDWRLYYIQNSVAGNSPAQYQVYTALSNNQGRNFPVGSAVLAQRAGAVTTAARTDGFIRMFYTQPVAGSSNTVILSALSTSVNGDAFNLEAGVRASTTAPSALSAPLVVRSTEAAPAFRWRLYYTVQDSLGVGIDSETVISAVTEFPDPTSISPNTVFQGNAPVVSTIKGEIFSNLLPLPGLTASLQMAGQAAIPAAGVAKVDDQTFTATFNTQGAALGFWDLVVTNANGLSTTLPGVLNVDFQGGSVQMLDNLFRPRLGTKCKISATIFTAGKITVKVYTANGQLVNTLAEGDFPAGIWSFFWDGKNGSGHGVASGLYVVETKGPKLNVVNKVIVIK